jgi:hypothetical protein
MWLGDGGMFHFRDPFHAVQAGLEIVEQAPAIGLPPAHIGIHAGPVVFQDDVYVLGPHETPVNHSEHNGPPVSRPASVPADDSHDAWRGA